MKKSLVFAFSAGILAFVAYRQGLIQKLTSRIRNARMRRGELGIGTQAHLGTEAEAPHEVREQRRRRPRLKMRGHRRPSHFTADGLLDLNTASEQELQSLSGIGPALAERIIENRPYVTKIDLVGRMIIPEASYEVIKHEITVLAA